MTKETNVINCPQCGAEINVSEILYQQVEGQIRNDFETRNANRQREYDKKIREIEDEKASIAKQKETFQQEVNAAIQQRLGSERTQIEKKLRAEIEDEKSEQVKTL